MSAEVINLSCYKFAPLEGLEELRTRLQEATKEHGL
jgi:predicted sulfurtransferase